ncbi:MULTISPECIES: hypothetical protein [Bradyrhizobium]|jgi:hypothetical protein|uniref:hypothetical protein n=1 Tax=Bradyrhizobium TaxID=374 RepID=UPI000231C46C|nr:hypothetical protein [Bradyrhizobium japonicum]KMK00422.1 hypothetical protein CF64_07255 [Bradyrhizobium japonicum]MCS3535003.1 hypothetical protein [Bradyrhizobium japonicum]MCS3988900.1 hypothetical protein [Bradyrhizobium japonicum]MCS4016284.1 hypothetical protein [Bradyrhizobium japonicum]MCS4203379.1 hypothetical protein [Bradyrhizobium japonicum]
MIAIVTNPHLGIVTDEGCERSGVDSMPSLSRPPAVCSIEWRTSAQRLTGTRFKLKALLKMKMRSGVTPMSIQPTQDWRARPVSEMASYQGARRTVSEVDADILRKRALKKQRALIDTLNGRAPS